MYNMAILIFGESISEEITLTGLEQSNSAQPEPIFLLDSRKFPHQKLYLSALYRVQMVHSLEFSIEAEIIFINFIGSAKC
jgi:hypothetical protein